MKFLCTTATVLAAALTALLAGNAHAQKPPIYRCGSSYSQTPCEGARSIDASDTRSAQQKSESEEVARSGKAAGDRLERERLHAEALQAREITARDRRAAEARKKAVKAERDETTARVAATKKKPKKKDPGYFTVAAPAEPKK